MDPFQTLPDGTLVGPGFLVHPAYVTAIVPYETQALLMMETHPNGVVISPLLADRVIEAVRQYRARRPETPVHMYDALALPPGQQAGPPVDPFAEQLSWPLDGADPAVGVVPGPVGTIPDFGGHNIDPNSPDTQDLPD